MLKSNGKVAGHLALMTQREFHEKKQFSSYSYTEKIMVI